MKTDYEASKQAPFSLLEEPLLSFRPDDQSLDVNPLRGLDSFGPYSSATFSTFTSQLRVATIAPSSGWAGLRSLIETLRTRQQPGDRKEYVPPFRGFQSVFKVPLVAASALARIKLPDDLGASGGSGPQHLQLMHSLRGAIDRLAAVRDQFDVTLVHLPDAWQAGFRAPGFDAHDALKALSASAGIPTQVINDRAIEFTFKASIAWRLSIALYVKAGGVPWKLAPLPGVPEATAYIGLAYALRGDPQTGRTTSLVVRRCLIQMAAGCSSSLSRRATRFRT